MTEESGFYSQQGRDIPLFFIARSALGPTWPPVQTESVLSPGAKRPEREPAH